MQVYWAIFTAEEQIIISHATPRHLDAWKLAHLNGCAYSSIRVIIRQLLVAVIVNSLKALFLYNSHSVTQTGATFSSAIAHRVPVVHA